MPTRYLKESICTSESLALLSAEAERFWYRLLVRCDDYGRMDARPIILRALCFPLLLDSVSADAIACWLNELETARLLRLYEHAGKPYLIIPGFVIHNKLRAKTSKWPAPPEDNPDCGHTWELADSCTQMSADADNCLQMSP